MKQHQFDLRSQEYFHDPLPTLAAMREAGPLVKTKLPLIGSLWMATTYEAAASVLRDKQNFVLQAQNAGLRSLAGMRWWMPRSFRVLTKNMLTSDEPDHRRLRELVEQAFLRQSIDDMRPRLEVLADRYLDDLQREAEQNQGQADLLPHFARPFPLAVICELLGLPEEDRALFTAWASGLTRMTSTWGMLRAMSGISKLLRYLRGQFDQCRRQPRPGLISDLVNAQHEGKQLSQDELLAMSFLLLLAGHETTVYLISDGLLALLTHADQRQALTSDWSLAETAVDEMLRYMSPIQFSKPRYATCDMELFGQQINRGEIVIGMLAAANTDPAQFDQADQFLIDRKPNPHIGFGTGIHVCLGLKLARAEVAIAMQRIFTRFPGLELTKPAHELQWTGRIGMRALKSLPLSLHQGNQYLPQKPLLP